MTTTPFAGGLVPLAQRLYWICGARLTGIAIPVLLWFALPSVRSAPLDWLLPPAAALAVLTVLSAPMLRLGRGMALSCLTVCLLLDGVYLAWAFLSLGGLDGPIGYLVLLYAVAVTLLLSFRTGVKVMLWCSMTLLVAVEAELVGLFGVGPLTGGAFPTERYTLLLAALWIIGLATASFAALNERELRRRRYDVEVLLRLAKQLELTTDTAHIATLLARLAHEELAAARSMVVVHPHSSTAPGQGAHRAPRRVAVLVEEAQAPRVTRLQRPIPDGSLLAAAIIRGGPVLAASVDAHEDGWLLRLLPDAANLLVVPFTLSDEVVGALIMEHGTASRLGLRRGRRIERRRMAAAQQATAHAAQAFGRAALVDRLTTAADTDGLTGLANRRTFDSALNDACTRHQQIGTTFSVLMVDLDAFKALNDQHGHQAGDDALRVVGRVLESSCREVDLAARYGGEEFAMILPGAGRDDAQRAAERIRAKVEAATGCVPVTASIGVASAPHDGSVAFDLMAAADAALYRAKAGGRNQVVVSDSAGVSQ